MVIKIESVYDSLLARTIFQKTIGLWEKSEGNSINIVNYIANWFYTNISFHVNYSCYMSSHNSIWTYQVQVK